MTTQPNLNNLEIYKAFLKSPYLSIKYSDYFQVYEELLSPYRNKEITFVEVGILNGGSLFMWRDFFGPEARIIGIDLNPLAKRWEKDGFEIYIGSQSDPKFWKSFFNTVGAIDVLLDDGGHTNEQQIVTTYESIPFIKDGGLLLVEDVHTSYFSDFDNPSNYSFINYAKLFIDGINARFDGVNVRQKIFRDAVYSVKFYSSIVGFCIDRRKCFNSKGASNEGKSMEAEDYRRHDSFARKTNRDLVVAFKKFGIKFSMSKLLKLIEKLVVSARLKQYFKN